MLIFLTGFMGSGKSTTGKKLAKALAMNFIDLDQYIESKEGTTIPELFAAKGEEVFRKIESKWLKSLEETENMIVATGGGTPCFHDNMSWMNRHGITVYIRMSPGGLYRRLTHAVNERPLLIDKKGEELEQYIRELVQSREKYYLKAQNTVKGESIDVRSLASWIRERLRPFN